MLNAAFLGAFFPWTGEVAPMEDPTTTPPSPSSLADTSTPEKENTQNDTQAGAPQNPQVLALETNLRLLSPSAFLEENIVKKFPFFNLKQAHLVTQKGKTTIWWENREIKEEPFFSSLNKVIRNPICKEVCGESAFSFLRGSK